jgi:8-oxo-dGTP pyrophosphatase MutT (NUDIX family)
MSSPPILGIKTFGKILPGITYLERPGAYAFIRNNHLQLAVVKTGFGLFLPGGGLDPGEDELAGLNRELREEIGYEIIDAVFLMRAAQYHWSEFYKNHFKKIGSFFTVNAKAPATNMCASDHELIWLPTEQAAAQLSQEFQRWATTEYSKQSI